MQLFPCNEGAFKRHSDEPTHNFAPIFVPPSTHWLSDKQF